MHAELTVRSRGIKNERPLPGLLNTRTAPHSDIQANGGVKLAHCGQHPTEGLSSSQARNDQLTSHLPVHREFCCAMRFIFLRWANFARLRAFNSPGGQTWQNSHALPLMQPS